MAEESIHYIAIDPPAVGMPREWLHAVATLVVSAGKPLMTEFLDIDGVTRGVQVILGN
jgi:hypothetical protein